MGRHVRRCILGCSRGATLHKFPNDEEKKKLWLKIIKMEHCPLKNMYICTRHFSGDVKGKKRTTWNAVPNINLRRISDNEELESEDQYSEAEDSDSNQKIVRKKLPIELRSKKVVYLTKNRQLVPSSNKKGIVRYDPLYAPSKNICVVKHKVKVVKGNALKIKNDDDDETSSPPEHMIIDDTVEETTKLSTNSRRTLRSTPVKHSITKQRLKIVNGKAYKINANEKEITENLRTSRKYDVPKKIVSSNNNNRHNELLTKVSDKSKSSQKLLKHNLSQTKIFKTQILPTEIEIPVKTSSNLKSNTSFIVNENVFEEDDSFSGNETFFMEEDSDDDAENSQTMNSRFDDEDDSIQYIEVIKSEPLSAAEESMESNKTTSKKKRQKCGFIERYTGNSTFFLVCCYCPTEFELWDWEKFIIHLKEEHKYGTRKYRAREKIETETKDEIKSEPNITEIIKIEKTEEAPPKKRKKQINNISSKEIADAEENLDNIAKENLNDIYDEKNEYENVEIYIDNENEENFEDSEDWPIDTVEEKDNIIEVLVEKIEDNDVDNFYDGDNNVSQDTEQGFIEQEVNDEIIDQEELENEYEDQDIEYILQDHENSRIDDHGDYLDQEVDDENENQKKPYRENNAVIHFKVTSPDRILKFLNILQAHPLLWHSRRGGTIVHDDEVEKFLKEFGDETMTPVDFRRSMDHVRYQHRRFTPLTANLRLKLQNDSNLRKYYQLINKIVELSAPLIHQCEHCTFYYFDKAGLNTHMYLKHKIGNLPYVCSCSLRFPNEQEKEEHENLHKLNPRFTCELCNEAFVLQRLLSDHMNQCHPEACEDPLPYKCGKCDAKFPTRLKRHYHMMKHVIPRFTCDQCGQSYKTRFRYKIHLKSHTNQRDFVCEHCGKAFLEKRHLNEHLFRVHRDGGLECKYCHTFYSCRESLEEHNQKFHPNGTNLDRMKKIRRHFNSKYSKHYEMKSTRVYKCKYCGKYFERMWELVKHKRITGHNLQIYHCPNCTATLSSAKTLIGHLQRIHKLSVSTSADIENLLIDDGNCEDIKMEEAEYFEEIDIQSES